MVKISGSLDIQRGFVRLKPNIPFLGVTAGINTYEINEGQITIELPPTPQDRVFLVDYSLSRDGAFLPIESWVVPNYDCNLDEVRGIISFKHNLQLQTQINELQSEKEKLQTDLLETQDKYGQSLLQLKQLSEQLSALELEKQQAEIDNGLLVKRIHQISAIANP
ncbi:MAG: hypothetical protein ACK5V6_11450 [Pseudanabaena sp.]